MVLESKDADYEQKATRETPVVARNTGPSAAVARQRGKDEPMKVRNSLKSLKHKEGSTVVQRHGRTVIVNKRHPRWKARQG